MEQIGPFERALRLAVVLNQDEKIALVKAMSVEKLYTQAELDAVVKMAMDAFWADIEWRMKATSGILRLK